MSLSLKAFIFLGTFLGGIGATVSSAFLAQLETIHEKMPVTITLGIAIGGISFAFVAGLKIQSLIGSIQNRIEKLEMRIDRLENPDKPTPT